MAHLSHPDGFATVRLYLRSTPQSISNPTNRTIMPMTPMMRSKDGR
jgi:hypothetical protein